MNAEQLAALVSHAVETATEPLHARILVLERQKSAEPVKGDPGAKGADGRDADMTLVLDMRRELESLRAELALTKSASWLIDESGELVAAQNGQLQKLGRVRGRDAEPVVIDLEAIARKAASLVPVPLNGKDAAPIDVDAIAQKAAALIEKPKDGKDATVDVDAIAKQAAALVPVPKDGANGKDATVDLEAVALKAAALVPKPADGKDGRSVSLDDVLPHVQSSVSKALAELPKPRDGRDVEIVTVQTLVDAAVVKAVAALPAPPPYTVDVFDFEPHVRAEVAKAVAQIQPREPVGIVGAITDRGGHLILTKSDGGTIDAGVVIGRDGADVDMGEIAKSIKAAVAEIPRPADGKDGQNGADGKDGADGFGFDDMDVVVDEVRKGCFLRFTKGDRVKEFRIKGVPMHCGIYDDSQEYFKGNEVTRGGSTWLMQADHVKGVKPDDTPESRKVWKLAAMRGKEGKQGQRGPEGPAGRDRRWEGDSNG